MSGVSPTPPVDRAFLPANIRDASAERRKEYDSALSFERVLVGQLTEQLMKSSPGSEDAPAAVKAMRANLPTTLADSLMAAGGIGLAAQLDASWHPEAQTKTSLSGNAPQATADAPADGAGGVSA